jgi:hypothetical protein
MLTKTVDFERTNGGLTVWLVETWRLFGFIPIFIKRVRADRNG